MKKLYTLAASIALTAIMGTALLAQVTITSPGAAWANIGNYLPGDELQVTGTFQPTADDGQSAVMVVFGVQRFNITLDDDGNDEWNEVTTLYMDTIHYSDRGDLSSGTIDYTYTIPEMTASADFVITGDTTRSFYITQCRVWYNTTSDKTNDIYHNNFLSIINDGLDITGGIMTGAWGTLDTTFVAGNTLNVQGTFSQTMVGGDDGVYDISSVSVSVMAFKIDADDAWEEISDLRDTIHDGGIGLASSAFNYDYVIPTEVVPTAELPQADGGSASIHVLQVRAAYDEDHSQVDQFVLNYVNIGKSISTIYTPSISAMRTYPNPVATGDFITFDNKDFVGQVNVVIYDITGSAVYSEVLDASNMSINSNELTPGVYVFQVNDGVSYAGGKIVVE